MQAVRDVARLAVVVGALALGTPTVWAGSDGGTVNDNCPAGFVWIRMSGTGCVQEALPAQGKIGYDGHALCIEPYVGIYEQRATTDGQPAPGTPYNSFAYLLSCVAQEDYEQAVAEMAEDSGGTLSVATVAGLSVVGAAVVLGGAAVLAGRRRSGPHLRQNPRVTEINNRLDALAKERSDLDAKAEQLRRRLNRKEWNASDLNEILGVITSLVSAGATAEATRLGTELAKAVAKWTGVLSAASTAGGLVFSEEEIRDMLVTSLEKIGLEQGEIESEQASLQAELERLAEHDDPDRLAAEAYTDHDVIQNRIDEVRDEIGDLQRQRNGHAQAQLELQRDLDGIQQANSELQNLRIEFERRQDIIADWGKKNATMALVAGIAALGLTTGPLAGLALTSLGTAGSLASFTAWWVGASAGDRREAIALGLQGNALLRGTVMNQIDQAHAQEQAVAKQIDAATDYKGRLRSQQAKIASKEGRKHLWSDG